MPSIGNCSEALDTARAWLAGAERVAVGAGAGLSAAGGLDYGAQDPVRRWFPEYWARGFRSLAQIQGQFWWFRQCEPEAYWAYWARHILHIRYETGLLPPYRDLGRLLDGREVFAVTTNADGQLFRVLPREQIFAPQGGYQWLQCEKPCCDEVFESEAMVRRMVEHMPSPFRVRAEDVPRCPRCGGYLVPNLRIDGSFVEAPHLWNRGAYEAFLREGRDRDLVLLELGVGFNTPAIIRWPFEALCARLPRSRLIRVNRDAPAVPEELGDRAVGIAGDVGEVLAALI